MINLKRKYWLLGILILIVAAAIIWLVFPQSLPEFSLNYFYTSELTYQKIDINQSRLTYTYFEGLEDFNEGNEELLIEAQTPRWTEEDLKTKEATLSKNEIEDLISLINQTNFMKLEDVYGGSGQYRYYPVEIVVKLGEKEKKVIYRSSLDALPEPEAFKMVEDKLFELINKKFNL